MASTVIFIQFRADRFFAEFSSTVVFLKILFADNIDDIDDVENKSKDSPLFKHIQNGNQLKIQGCTD